MPTVKGIDGPYRLFFYSFDCNEPPHVHVQRERRVCKFWLASAQLAHSTGFSAHELGTVRRLVSMHRTAIEEAWHEHCG
jgi:hypothetical protein